jgi:hypothetical protein
LRVRRTKRCLERDPRSPSFHHGHDGIDRRVGCVQNRRFSIGIGLCACGKSRACGKSQHHRSHPLDTYSRCHSRHLALDANIKAPLAMATQLIPVVRLGLDHWTYLIVFALRTLVIWITGGSPNFEQLLCLISCRNVCEHTTNPTCCCSSRISHTHEPLSTITPHKSYK